MANPLGQSAVFFQVGCHLDADVERHVTKSITCHLGCVQAHRSELELRARVLPLVFLLIPLPLNTNRNSSCAAQFQMVIKWSYNSLLWLELQYSHEELCESATIDHGRLAISGN